MSQQAKNNDRQYSLRARSNKEDQVGVTNGMESSWGSVQELEKISHNRIIFTFGFIRCRHV